MGLRLSQRFLGLGLCFFLLVTQLVVAFQAQGAPGSLIGRVEGPELIQEGDHSFWTVRAFLVNGVQLIFRGHQGDLQGLVGLLQDKNVSEFSQIPLVGERNQFFYLFTVASAGLRLVQVKKTMWQDNSSVSFYYQLSLNDQAFKISINGPNDLPNSHDTILLLMTQARMLLSRSPQLMNQSIDLTIEKVESTINLLEQLRHQSPQNYAARLQRLRRLSESLRTIRGYSGARKWFSHKDIKMRLLSIQSVFESELKSILPADLPPSVELSDFSLIRDRRFNDFAGVSIRASLGSDHGAVTEMILNRQNEALMSPDLLDYNDLREHREAGHRITLSVSRPRVKTRWSRVHGSGMNVVTVTLTIPGLSEPVVFDVEYETSHRELDHEHFNVSEFEHELVREFHRVLAEVRQQHPELFRQSQSTGQGPRRVSTGASGGGETQSPSRVRVADVGSDSVGVTSGEAAVQACGAQLEVSRGSGPAGDARSQGRQARRRGRR